MGLEGYIEADGHICTCDLFGKPSVPDQEIELSQMDNSQSLVALFVNLGSYLSKSVVLFFS